MSQIRTFHIWGLEMEKTIQNDLNQVNAKVQEIKTTAEEASRAVKEVIAAMEKAAILFAKLKSYCPNGLNNTTE